jgi:hypothetical protein
MVVGGRAKWFDMKATHHYIVEGDLANVGVTVINQCWNNFNLIILQ